MNTDEITVEQKSPTKTKQKKILQRMQKNGADGYKVRFFLILYFSSSRRVSYKRHANAEQKTKCV